MLPSRVLGVPVERVLDQLAVLGDRVAHDAGGDPVGDLLRLGGDGHDDLEHRAVVVGLAIGPAGARRHRPVGVVDLGGEVRRVEVDGFVATRQGGRGRIAVGRRRHGRRFGRARPPPSVGAGTDDGSAVLVPPPFVDAGTDDGSAVLGPPSSPHEASSNAAPTPAAASGCGPRRGRCAGGRQAPGWLVIEVLHRSVRSRRYGRPPEPCLTARSIATRGNPASTTCRRVRRSPTVSRDLVAGDSQLDLGSRRRSGRR